MKKNLTQGETTGEASRLVTRILEATGDEKIEAARKLGSLGVSSRRSVRTRGSLAKVAASRLPESKKADDLAQGLKDNDPRVRSQIAFALGEWGGEREAAAIAGVLEEEDNKEVRLYFVTALRTIGGPTATKAIRGAAESGTEIVRDAAISAIEDLATGGRVDCTEVPETELEQIHPEVRVRGATLGRGAIRTRGARAVRVRGARTVRTRGAGSIELADEVASTLAGIAGDKTCSEYLRGRADRVLRYLK